MDDAGWGRAVRDAAARGWVVRTPRGRAASASPDPRPVHGTATVGPEIPAWGRGLSGRVVSETVPDLVNGTALPHTCPSV